ncbi:MAG: hypothetical protein KDB27_15000 [Planctomycetales bacterium]|nr:hypothetical protein [Planctomycetales bacterium]
MNESRKLLLPGLLAVIAIAFVGDKAYQNLYVNPLREKQNRLKNMEEDLHDTKMKIKIAQKKLPELDTVQARSLPYQIDLAVSQYRGWLFRLFEEVGLQRTSVDSGQPVRVGKLYDRLSFSVSGSGTLDQVTLFMHKFYSAGHLHIIRSVTFNPTATGRIDLSMSIEALALASAASKDQLTTEVSTQLASTDQADYRFIGKRNLFSATGALWLQSTQLAAITKNASGKPQAWFNAGSASTTVIVDEGESSQIAGHDIELVSATADQASILVDGDEVRISIGQSLQEAID